MLKIIYPALFVPAVLFELCFVYIFKIWNTQIAINLNGFFINLFYGIAVGSTYLLYVKHKSNKYGGNLPRLLLLLLPMFILSLFFIGFRLKGLLLIDTLGMPYLNFTELYYGERLAAHLSYFCTGLFLILTFSKDDTFKGKQNILKYICCSTAFILLILCINLIIEKILSYAIMHQSFNYYCYEFIVLFINIGFGILLCTMLYLTSNAVKTNSRKRTFYLTADLFCALLGGIPFLFIYISYHTNFTVPYNHPYYLFMQFCRQSDFFQVFQILFGILVIPTIKNWVSKEE